MSTETWECEHSFLKQIIIMKNSIMMVAAAILFFAACNKVESEAPVEMELAASSKIIVNLETAAAGTKVTNATDANEQKVNNVQVYVFRNHGGEASANEIDGSKHFAAAESTGYSVDCTVGERKVYVVVNANDGAKDVKEVTNEQQLLDRVTNLGENTPSKLLMIGKKDVKTTASFETTIQVYRMVAAVLVDKVNVNFSSPALQESGTLVITDMYLANVTGRNNYANTTNWSALESAYWFNQLGTDAARTACPETVKALTQESGLSISLKHGQCTEDGQTHTFYCFPNNCTHAEGAPFTQRATKLVVKATLNGKTYYYPCDLSRANNQGDTIYDLKANYKYHLTLNINRPGSEDPDSPVVISASTFQIKVEDWTSGQTYNFSI